MLLSTPKQTRQIVVGIIIVAALLMILYVPFLGFDMVNPIVTAQQARIEKFYAENNPQAPLLELTVWLVSFFYPFWSTMSVIAGIGLLVIALPLYRGERWTRGLALILASFPAIGGAYMIVPWMNFVGSAKGGFPPAVIMMSFLRSSSTTSPSSSTVPTSPLWNHPSTPRTSAVRSGSPRYPVNTPGPR